MSKQARQFTSIWDATEDSPIAAQDNLATAAGLKIELRVLAPA